MITAYAKAKLNLGLNIVGRREDGYHLLDTVMQQIWLCDILHLRRNPTETLEVTGGPPGEDNLVWRAAALYRRHYGIGEGLSIRLEKVIPAGSGLGGGSSDAAATLVALDALYGNATPLPRLQDWGESLGADVPFALTGGAARVTGIGEKAEPLESASPLYGVVLMSSFSLSTPQVYSRYDKTRRDGSRASIPGVIEGLRRGDPAKVSASLGNALEEPALELAPELRRLARALESTRPLGIQMTGSGAAFFALYADRTAADRAAFSLRPAFPFVCSFETAPPGVPIVYPRGGIR
ncbi:MAG: 4-(cytidine 5'-diphospho)-2-C-methyl-D-erythritol kinase [Christensenellales bacterium]|jgi:4-diphosphocytidyl-2-C-methyl-D-erythritol kinase